jgi:DNA-binding FrmR family transcriptional regulator
MGRKSRPKSEGLRAAEIRQPAKAEVPEREKLAQRLHKVRGQMDAVERAIEEGSDCGDQLMLLAAVRGGVNALMATVLETHIRVHLTGDAQQRIAPDLAEDLLQLVRSYLK